MGWFVLPYVTFNLFLLLLHFPPYTYSLCNHDDNFALLQFKNSLIVNTSHGYGLSCPYSSKTESWKNGTDCCEWDGVTCDIHSGHVIGLDLSCSNLQGVIHPNSTIFQLRQLQQLNLAVNDFSRSSIPSGIGDLVSLTHLNLSHSKIGGDIPSSISHLSKLVSLDLSVWGMRLSPYTWKKLILNATNLRELRLEYANMSSIRESSLSLLLNLSSSLVFLSLSDTGLQGYMPSDILSLPNLQELDLSHNFEDLRGQLPKSNWSTPPRYLDLIDTKFSGEIPNSIGHLKSLNYLSLGECEFHGPVPPSLWNLTQLTHLNLGGNNINGEIPSLISNLRHLTSCYLYYDNFSGHIPDVFGKLTKLEILSLYSNNLGGQVPPSLFHLTQLSELDLQYNKLVGPIPHWCYSLPSLSRLYLNDNQLTGSVGEFSTYSMKSLSLSNNKLHGDFPNSIFEFENLTDLGLSSTNLSGLVDFQGTSNIFDVSNNNFSGPLPISCIKNFQGMVNVSDSQIGLQYMGRANYYNDSVVVIMKGLSVELNRILTTFTTIDLSKNMFEGEIPQVIGELLSLKGLNLSHNGITGTIPQSLSDLRSLEWLDLSWNHLTGAVPVALTSLNFLSFLNLSQNQLEGIIPTGKQFNTFENNSYEGNPMLCGFPLSKSCNKGEEQPPHSTIHHEEESGFGWKSVAVGYACGAVFGMLLGYNVFWNGKPQWLARLVERMFNTRLRRTNNRGRANRRGMN